MGDFSLKDVIVAVGELIAIRQRMISVLTEFQKEIERSNVPIKGFKTFYNLTSIVGTVLLFTPAATLGAGMVVGGAAGSIATSVDDIVTSRKIQNALLELLKKERPYADKLEDMLIRLEKYTGEVAAYHSMDYNTAAALVVAKFAMGGIKYGVVQMAESGSIPKAAGTVVTKIVTSPRLAGTTAAKILAKPGAQTAGKIFKKALGPISIGLDVVDIIYTWNSDAPGVKDVKEVISKLESGIKDVEKVLEMFPAA